MKRIDRMNLLDRIGRELQSRMTYSDIDVYLAGFGIDSRGHTPSTNSKWVYSKEVLAPAADETILKIADELGIEHGYSGPPGVDVTDSKFWLPGHFKLFLSHISAFKKQTALLRFALMDFGISGFVAHEDIEPTKEWLIEIEKALWSMDALAAILMPGFHESSWTDHETGIAIGRGVLVVPIRRGLDPYGFIGKFQGVPAHERSVMQVAEAVFKVLATNRKSKARMLDCLVDLLLLTTSTVDAKRKLHRLRQIDSIPQQHLEKIRTNAPKNEALMNSEEVVSTINELLTANEMETLQSVQPSTSWDEPPDELPF